MSSTSIRKAGCGCGAVKFEVAGEPERMYLCHCIDCKHRTGSAFVSQTWWPRDVLKVTDGRDKIIASMGQAVPERVEDAKDGAFFCGTCLSYLLTFNENAPDVVFIGIGNFEDPSFFQPKTEFFSKRRCGWLTPVEGAVQRKELRE